MRTRRAEPFSAQALANVIARAWPRLLDSLLELLRMGGGVATRSRERDAVVPARKYSGDHRRYNPLVRAPICEAKQVLKPLGTRRVRPASTAGGSRNSCVETC